MKRKQFIKINQEFVCANCDKTVPPHPAGSCRNHCPFCLRSRHVDAVTPGDRAGECGGLMPAVSARADAKKGAVLTFRCQICGAANRNKTAPDDDWGKVCQLSRVPESVQ